MANKVIATAPGVPRLEVELTTAEEAAFEAGRTPSLTEAKEDRKARINEKASEIILAKYPITKQLTNLRLGIDMSDMDLVRDYSNTLSAQVEEATSVAQILAIDITNGWPTI